MQNGGEALTCLNSPYTKGYTVISLRTNEKENCSRPTYTIRGDNFRICQTNYVQLLPQHSEENFW